MQTQFKRTPGKILFLQTYTIQEGDVSLLDLDRYYWTGPSCPIEPLTPGPVTIGIWVNDITSTSFELINRIPTIRAEHNQTTWQAVRPVTLSELLDFDRRFPQEVQSIVGRVSDIRCPTAEQLILRCDNHGCPRVFFAVADGRIYSGDAVMFVFEQI
jgi:hypothetical protein